MPQIIISLSVSVCAALFASQSYGFSSLSSSLSSPRFAVVIIIIIIIKTERRQKEEEKEDDSMLKAYVKKEEDLSLSLRTSECRDAVAMMMMKKVVTPIISRTERCSKRARVFRRRSSQNWQTKRERNILGTSSRSLRKCSSR